MEKTVTFTMEEALISPMGFAILSGAGLIEASAQKEINVHMTAKVAGVYTSAGSTIDVDLTDAIPAGAKLADVDSYGFVLTGAGLIGEKLGIGTVSTSSKSIEFTAPSGFSESNPIILVDFYVSMSSGVTQLEITPDKFAGNYYLEASTLFRRNEDGVDLPAQFVIPNVKIQSAFNFAMAATGDPSTFTFTMDAFPDYTKFDRTKKLLFALQIVEDIA